MSALLRYVSLRRLQVVLGLVLMGLVFAPGASGAGQLDRVTATGSSGVKVPLLFNVNISAQSGPSGESPSGTASFVFFSGPVRAGDMPEGDR